MELGGFVEERVGGDCVEVAVDGLEVPEVVDLAAPPDEGEVLEEPRGQLAKCETMTEWERGRRTIDA